MENLLFFATKISNIAGFIAEHVLLAFVWLSPLIDKSFSIDDELTILVDSRSFSGEYSLLKISTKKEKTIRTKIESRKMR